MKKIVAALAILGVIAAGVQTASARDCGWSTAGKVLTGVFAAQVIASAIHPAPVYHTTTYYAPPPVYAAPAPVVVYPQPVYVQPAPVYVAPPRVFLPAPPLVSLHIGHGHGHKHHGRHHHHHHHRGHH